MLDEFVKKILEQSAAIKASPIPFALGVLAAGILIWVVIDARYATIISSKTAQLELADRKLADYKEKLAGASPDEAKAKMAELLAEIGALRTQIQGRRLTSEQRSKLSEAVRLPTGSKLELSIVRDMGASDGGSFANDFTTAFAAAGWRTAMTSMLYGGSAPSGMALLVVDQAKLTAAESLAMAGLRAANLQFDVIQMQRTGSLDSDARIWITGR